MTHQPYQPWAVQNRLAPLALAFVISAALPIAAFAQGVTGGDTAAAPTDNTVIQMATFTVDTSNIGSYREDTSSMATKIPTSLKELASSLEILNSTAIADRNALALPDVFAYVVGATQTQQAINGFSFRGLPNTGTFTQNIEFDGLMGATLKKGASSAADVDSLEFLKGPNGVLYGQMHPGGLLNIITKDPKEIASTTLRTTFGTFDGSNSGFADKDLETVTLDTTGPMDAGKHLLYRLIIDTGSIPTSRPGDFDRYFSIYPSLEYRWSKDTSFTIKFEDSQDNRRQDDGLIPIFTDGTAYGSGAGWYTAPFKTVYQDNGDRGRDYGQSVSTYFHTRIDGWTVRVQSRSVWHHDVTRELTVNNAGVYLPKATYATPNITLQRQYNLQNNGHRYNYFDANAFREFGPEYFKNTFIFGIGGGGEFSNNTRYAFGPNVTPAITLVNPILNQTPYPANGTGIQSQRNFLSALGEYASDQITIKDKLHITLGVRNDQQLAHGIDVFLPAKTPYSAADVKSITGQAGVVFDITSQVSTYASWSQSVLPNSVTSVDASGESDFPPEKGLQWEGGIKYETPSKNFFVSLASYYIDRSNVLVSTGTTLPVSGEAIFRLDGQQHSEGFEVESSYQPFSFWQLQGGVALGKAFIAASVKNPSSIGLDLIGAPRVSGNIWNRFNIPHGPLQGLGFGAGLIYVGKTWAGDPTTTVYYVLPGWTRMDASTYYKWGRNDFAINVNNALDRKYIASAQSAITLNPGETRKITFSVTRHF